MNTLLTRIKPAGRLISTIGEDLIGDTYAAIVELVKNSYDADATKVEIIFEYVKIDNEDALKIEVLDDGHGMSTEVVLNAWLVPATRNKLDKGISPKGRTFQGRKGIGRYAAAILGQELLLKTIDREGQLTEVLLNWSEFENAKYLEDVEIIVNSSAIKNASETSLNITAYGIKYTQWNRAEIGKLTNELRKLKSPFAHSENTFSINLAFVNCPYEEYNDKIFEIETFPIIDLYDYRILGEISKEGKYTCTYTNNAEQGMPTDVIEGNLNISYENRFGPISFDFRVFDRDSESISNLIDKGLIDPISRLAVGKRDAKRLLDEVYGVNLYREGFRIRPYGNGGIDWLNLDKDRIQNPSLRISNNQIVGFVNIKPENISHLEEKSARDGLKENSNYFGLISSLRKILYELETRRFTYRFKTGKGRQTKNVNKELETLFDYTALTNNIGQKLSHLKIDPSVTAEIAKIIHKDAEVKNKLLQNIQNTIAVYQGQATLGKIVTVLLHEGRKPIQYFKQQSPNLSRWLRHYKSKGVWDDELYDDILNRLENFKQQSDFLAGLFKRFDPLAKQNRGDKLLFNVKEAIDKACEVFEGQLVEKNIEVDVSSVRDVELYGWEEDIIIALTNLIENSIYWLDQIENTNKKIIIEIVENADEVIIHYKDSGPGISKDNIETSVIFEPGFSKKIDGTGLGLPIAGEAIERLNGSIIAHHSDSGVYFTIEIKK